MSLLKSDGSPLTGIINTIPKFEVDSKPRYFNFIKFDGKSYFFHISQFNGKWKDLIKLLEEKKEVQATFEIADDSTESRPRAKNVTII